MTHSSSSSEKEMARGRPRARKGEDLTSRFLEAAKQHSEALSRMWTDPILPGEHAKEMHPYAQQASEAFLRMCEKTVEAFGLGNDTLNKSVLDSVLSTLTTIKKKIRRFPQLRVGKEVLSTANTLKKITLRLLPK